MGSKKESISHFTQIILPPLPQYTDTLCRLFDFAEYSASDDECSDVKRHITALLKTGRDDTRATLDDVLISFERLRYNINSDLEEAANLIKLTSDLADEETLRLHKTAQAEPVLDEFAKSELKYSNVNGNHSKAETSNSHAELHVDEKQDMTQTVPYNEVSIRLITLSHTKRID